MTAQILTGNAHPYHDGINPYHTLFLSENDRSAWILVPVELHGQQHDDMRIVWLPTHDNTLEDALVMIAIHVLEDASVRALAESLCAGATGARFEFCEELDEAQREQLYVKCREISKKLPKLAISVFGRSQIDSQLGALDGYALDVEVCRSSRLDRDGA
jgi:hypothetical protein